MLPARLPLRAHQGDTFTLEFLWELDDEPVDLTGHTARMQVRATVKSTDPVIDASDHITLGDEDGTITVTVPATVMGDVAAGRYVYDLELEHDDVVTTVLFGPFIVDAEVTR